MHKNKLAFLTPCDQAFNPPFLGGKIIQLAKFCFKNKRFGQVYRFSVNKWLSLIVCKVSIPNFEISPRKYVIKKCIFSASIYIGKSHSLIHIFNNYRRTKCQTIV